MNEFNQKLAHGVSNGEVEIVGSEGEELCQSLACAQTQSAWTPGSKIKSAGITELGGLFTTHPPQLNLGPAISTWTLVLFTTILTKRRLTSVMEGFYLFVIFNKKWLWQCGVRLMCPKKRTCSLSGFVFFYCFWNPAFLFSLLAQATGQYWFRSSGISIWSWLKKQNWLKEGSGQS